MNVVIEGGKTENLSANDLAAMGFSAVAYPWTLVAAKLKSIRETLENLKASMTVGAPPMILSYDEVCEGVGFPRYWVCTNPLSRQRPPIDNCLRNWSRDTSMTRTEKRKRGVGSRRHKRSQAVFRWST
jgi:hypothetical protein